MKPKIGIIPGIIREEMAADLWGTLEWLASLGLRGVEGGALASGNIAENRRRAEALGLKTISIGAKREQLVDDPDGLIRTAEALGAEHIVLFWAPCDDRDALLRDAERYNKVGQACARVGLKFCYHNHDHELLTRHGDQRALEILMAETDPAAVHFEFDVAWLLYGQVDPAQYLAAHADRVALIHLKDVADLSERGQFTAISTGLVDVPAVLAVCEEHGIAWAVIEQDRPRNLSPRDSVLASVLNLKELGWM
jgi:sugar phosphate isomerase/epimerase